MSLAQTVVFSVVLTQTYSSMRQPSANDSYSYQFLAKCPIGFTTLKNRDQGSDAAPQEEPTEAQGPTDTSEAPSVEEGGAKFNDSVEQVRLNTAL